MTSTLRAVWQFSGGPMNLLFRTLYAHKCSSTHHKLALDALRYLSTENQEHWVQLFLKHVELYTDGAKAPDKKFKDFRNHVLHVSENNWGGAVKTAELWYGRLIEKLKEQDWPRAVYSAGVLSHYVTDPLMPLHTGQTEDEGQVHKFIEWGTVKIYEELLASPPAEQILNSWVAPESEPAPESDPDDWLGHLIITGAQTAHAHYDIMIDHYDPAIGRKNAAEGFDQTCRDSIALLLGWSVRAFSFVLDRAIAEANAAPGKTRLTLATVLSGVSTPIFWITRKLASAADRKPVKAIWDELQETGKVIKSLPPDEKEIREQHATEVLKVSLEELDAVQPRKAGTKRQQAATTDSTRETCEHKPDTIPLPKPGLTPKSPVVNAPSIGPKTAARLEQIGIETVEELLSADRAASVSRLRQKWITEELFEKWQQQAQLVCDVAGLRGHDAQLLVEAGITTKTDLEETDNTTVLQLVTHVSTTKEGQRILRDGQPPDATEVDRWKQFAAREDQKHAA